MGILRATQSQFSNSISYSSPNRWYIILHAWHILVTKIKSIDIYRGNFCWGERCFRQTCWHNLIKLIKRGMERGRMFPFIFLCKCLCIHCQLMFISGMHTNSANSFWLRKVFLKSVHYTAMHGIYHDINLHFRINIKINSHILVKISFIF